MLNLCNSCGVVFHGGMSGQGCCPLKKCINPTMSCHFFLQERTYVTMDMCCARAIRMAGNTDKDSIRGS